MKLAIQVHVTMIGCLLLAGGITAASAEDEPDPRDAVALVRYVAGDVKIRGARNLVWGAAKNHQRLFNHDAVKTGPESSALIVFNDSTQVSVDANSLVIVLDTGVKPGVRESAVIVPSGSVHGKLERDVDRPLELVVRTSRGWIKANSSTGDKRGSSFKAVVSAQAGLRVKSLSGNIKLLAKDRERELAPKEELRIAAGTEPASGEEAAALNEPPVLSDGEWVRERAIPASSKPKSLPTRPAAQPVRTEAKPAIQPQSGPKRAPSPTPAVNPLSAPEILTHPDTGKN